MDRSFPQRQEIDCSCFDFNSTCHQQSGPRRLGSKPFINAREIVTRHERSKTPKFLQSGDVKKSLRRKFHDESFKMSKNGSEKNAYKATRHQSTNTEWLPQVKQEKWIVVLTQGGILGKQLYRNKENRDYRDSFQSSLMNNTNTKTKPRVSYLYTDSSAKSFSKKPPTWERKRVQSIFEVVQQAKEKIQYELQRKSEQRTQQRTRTSNAGIQSGNFFKQKNRKKNSINQRPSQLESQLKNITNNSKRQSTISSIYGKESEKPMKVENIKKKKQEEIKNFKKVSIRAENNHLFLKQLQQVRQLQELQQIYPKQIESFEEQNLSSVESEVIEKGRYTWAPDSFKNIENQEQGQQFISSLHIRDSSRLSRRQTNRLSKNGLNSLHYY